MMALSEHDDAIRRIDAFHAVVFQQGFVSSDELGGVREIACGRGQAVRTTIERIG